MPLFHKKEKPLPYDPARQEPAVRKSICTGEMTLGFVDRQTGRFQDLMKADGEKDLEEFRRRTGVEHIKTIY